MRVISGRMRGHKLQTIGGSAVRPTSDRVKEAMFNILGPKPKGANVLDLFAGSGSLGIESISRGAQSAVFIDINPKTINILRRNLKHCKIENMATVIQWDIKNNLNCLHACNRNFNLIFMDPPYHRNLVSITMQHLLLSQCLMPHATIIAEHEPDCLIDCEEKLTLLDSRLYGNTQLSFFSYPC